MSDPKEPVKPARAVRVSASPIRVYRHKLCKQETTATGAIGATFYCVYCRATFPGDEFDDVQGEDL